MINQSLITNVRETVAAMKCEKPYLASIPSTSNSGKTTASLLAAIDLVRQGKKVCFVNYDGISQELLQKLVLAQNELPAALDEVSFVLCMNDIPWERDFDAIVVDGCPSVREEQDLLKVAQEHDVFILSIVRVRKPLAQTITP